MRFYEIRDIAKQRLSVNDSQLNDDIEPESWVDYVNEAYNTLILELQSQAPRENIVEYIDMAWPEGSLTLNLPDVLIDVPIYQIVQVDTSGNPCGDFPGYFETKNTLRTPSGYANIGFNIRVYFLRSAEKWDGGDGQTPLMVEERFHWLLVWRTLITIKSTVDKSVPDKWEKESEKLSFLFFKEHVARPIAQRGRTRLPNAPLTRPLV